MRGKYNLLIIIIDEPIDKSVISAHVLLLDLADLQEVYNLFPLSKFESVTDMSGMNLVIVVTDKDISVPDEFVHLSTIWTSNCDFSSVK